MHLVGFCADVGLCVFETRDGAVAEAAHHRHQGVEVLQLEQLLWTDRGQEGQQEIITIAGDRHGKRRGGVWVCMPVPKGI